MAAALAVAVHPLLADRAQVPVELEGGETIADVLRAFGVRLDLVDVAVFCNGERVPLEQLAAREVTHGDLLTLRPTVHGDDSNPIQAILTIAVLIASVYVPPLLGLTGTTAAFASAAIAVGGNLLVAALVPPRLPTFSSNDADTPSGTYSLTGGRNQPRAFQPMLLALGRHRVMPDVGAQPYTEFRDGDQYLYQLFHFGLIDATLSDFRIGDTPVARFDDLQLDVSSGDGQVPSFYADVDTVAGAELKLIPAWTIRTTATATRRIEIDIEGLLYQVGDEGLARHRFKFEALYRPVGATAWQTMLYEDRELVHAQYWSYGATDVVGYSSNDGMTPILGYRETDADHPDAVHTVGERKEANALGAWEPYQSGTTSNDEARAIYRWRWRNADTTYSAPPAGAPPAPLSPPTAGQVAAAAPVQTWTLRAPTADDVARHGFLTYNATVPDIELANDNTTPVRRTYGIDVPAGQYEVRLRRLSSESQSTRFEDRFSWTNLRSFQAETGEFFCQSRVGMRVRATGQLNGQVDTFSALAVSNIPVGQDAYFDLPRARLGETSNPADQFLYLARGKYHPTTGESIFGALLADAQIDIDRLWAWRAFCYAADLRCDIVFDRPMTVVEMLTIVAQCGRATPTWQNGTLGVVWDAPNQAPIAVYGMSNIVAGSFRVEYISENLADAIEARYVDRENDYKRAELTVTMPGVVDAVNTVRLEFAGVTREDQVRREAALAIARQYYHRRRIFFATDLEGWVCQRGDVIALSHDLTSWGYSGRVVELVPGGSSGWAGIRANREVTLDAQDHWITLRLPDNTRHTLRVVRPAAGTVTTDAFTFIDPQPDATPLPALPTVDNALDIVWLLDPDATPGKLVKIVGTRPVDENKIEIEAIDEVPEYYAYETTQALVPSRPDYVGRLARIKSITFAENPIDQGRTTRVTTLIEPEFTESVGVRYRVDGGNWIDLGELLVPRFELDLRVGAVLEVEAFPDPIVRIRGLTTGALTATHTVTGANERPPDVELFRVSRVDRDATFTWADVNVADLSHYRIRRGSSWASSSFVGDTIDLRYFLQRAPDGQYLIKAVDEGGLESANPAAVILEPYTATNIVVTRCEAALPWTGTHDRTVEIPEGVTLAFRNPWDLHALPWDAYAAPGTWDSYSDPENAGVYTTTVVDLGAEVTSFLDVTWQLTQATRSLVWDNWIVPWNDYAAPGWTWEGPSALAGIVDVEVRTRPDGGAWSAWAPFTAGDVTAREVQARALLTRQANGYAPILVDLCITADVPDRRLTFEDQPVAAGGTVFTFAPAFVVPPTISVAIQEGAPGDTYRVTAKTTSSVTIALDDSAGGPKAGNIDLIAEGY